MQQQPMQQQQQQPENNLPDKPGKGPDYDPVDDLVGCVLMVVVIFLI